MLRPTGMLRNVSCRVFRVYLCTCVRVYLFSCSVFTCLPILRYASE